MGRVRAGQGQHVLLHPAESTPRRRIGATMKSCKRPILLVEDDQVDVLTTRRALKEIHVTNPLVVCENGEEGLAWLRDNAEAPCLVLLDLNMPVMNGIEFL